MAKIMTGLANEIQLAAQVSPPRVSDDAGVPLAVHHLEFVKRTAQDLADWRARRAPLGMTPAVYRQLRRTFFRAVRRDGLPSKIDARLKGSSAVVYSGLHKMLPKKHLDMVMEFASAHGRAPSALEEDQIRECTDQMSFGQPWPRRRPFDSMHYLTLHPEMSDYDIQLSSDDIEKRCNVIFRQGVVRVAAVQNPRYGFLDDRLVALAIPVIMLWANGWTSRLGRTVNVKAFTGVGPPNKTSTIGELSSHFRTQDWIISPLQKGVD